MNDNEKSDINNKMINKKINLKSKNKSNNFKYRLNDINNIYANYVKKDYSNYPNDNNIKKNLNDINNDINNNNSFIIGKNISILKIIYLKVKRQSNLLIIHIVIFGITILIITIIVITFQ